MDLSLAVQEILPDGLYGDMGPNWMRGVFEDQGLAGGEAVDATCHVIEWLLEKKLVSVWWAHDCNGKRRELPSGAVSPSEVAEMVRVNFERAVNVMDWGFSVRFVLTEQGARLAEECLLLFDEDDDDDLGAPVVRVEGKSLDAVRVASLLAQWSVDPGLRARFISTREVVDALFERLSAGARQFVPGDRYWGRLFRLDDGTVVGKYQGERYLDTVVVEVRFPDRSYDRCVWPGSRPKEYQVPGLSVTPTSRLLDEALARGRLGHVSLAELDARLARRGIGVDEASEHILELIERLVDEDLAVVGASPQGLVSKNAGFMPWALSGRDTVERMRTELVVFGYEAWLWSATILLSEKGMRSALDLNAEQR